MFLHILSIIAPIAACAAVGFLWGRSGRPYDAPFVTRLVMNVGAPFLILSSFQRSQPGVAALSEVGLAAVLVTAGTAVAALAALRILHADTRTYLPPIVFQNTGNMGLPLCLFAFGDSGLALAIVVFMWVSMANFTVGVAIASGERNVARVLRTPLVWATFVSIALSVAGVTLPHWVRNTADILGGLTIPMMLITLGVSLSKLRVKMLSRSALFASMRFVFGCSMGWAISALLGLEGVARGVVILQSSMPPAVFNYLIAARYERGEDEIAGVVVVGTAISTVVIPVVLWMLLR